MRSNYAPTARPRVPFLSLHTIGDGLTSEVLQGGYAQAAALLRGECSREEAIAAAQQGHRNYAKRQLTWFRKDPDLHWLAGFGGAAAR